MAEVKKPQNGRSKEEAKPKKPTFDHAVTNLQNFFNGKTSFFKVDDVDPVGSTYHQMATLIYLLGIVVTCYVSFTFSPGVGYVKYIFGTLLFLGLYTVEHGMHSSAIILIKAAATDRQKPWLVATIVLGAIFIFFDTTLLVQSKENNEIAEWLTKYTSFLIGGEACIVFLLMTRALCLDDRRRAKEYNNGAQSQGFYAAVADALEELRLMAQYNEGVRGEHRYSMRQSLKSLRRGIRSRASAKTRKDKGIERGKMIVSASMDLVSRDLNVLSSDIAGAINRLKESDTLDDFLEKAKN